MWKKVKLGDICNTSSGGTPSRSKSEYFKDGNIPWILSGDLNKNEIIESKNYITDLGLKNSSAKIFPINSILIAMYGATIGKASILRIEAATNQAICCIFPNPKYNFKFLFYYLKSIQNELIQLGMGNAQPNISQSIIKELEIPLPPLPIQEKIATILDKADELRSKDKDLQAKYDELAQAIFIDMFGDPVRNEKGWEVKKLGELCSKILSGNTPKGGSEVYVESGIKFFRSQNVWKNRLDLDDIAYIDEATHKKMKNTSLKNKDILITKTGRINTENSSLGRAALYSGENDSANLNGHVYLIRVYSKFIIPEFLVFILTTIQYRDHIRSVCVGGIDKRQLNKEHIQDFPIILPPLHLQQSFARKIELINQLKVQTNAEKSEELFQSLLQKAFKGELVS